MLALRCGLSLSFFYLKFSLFYFFYFGFLSGPNLMLLSTLFDLFLIRAGARWHGGIHTNVMCTLFSIISVFFFFLFFNIHWLLFGWTIAESKSVRFLSMILITQSDVKWNWCRKTVWFYCDVVSSLHRSVQFFSSSSINFDWTISLQFHTHYCCCTAKWACHFNFM